MLTSCRQSRLGQAVLPCTSGQPWEVVAIAGSSTHLLLADLEPGQALPPCCCAALPGDPDEVVAMTDVLLTDLEPEQAMRLHAAQPCRATPTRSWP